jgi:hypothetical protein
MGSRPGIWSHRIGFSRSILLLTLILNAGAAAADPTDGPDPADPTRSRSGYESDETMGGPGSTSEQLQEDDRVAEPVLRLQWLDEAIAPYFDFKRRGNERYGLAFGADYTMVLQGASKSAGSDEATSGMFRFFGAWDAIGRESGNIGTVVYKIENRHDLGTSTAVQDLGFELGYAGITAAAFGDYRNKGWGLTNLFWRQRLGEGRFTAVAGIVDATDYVDVYGLVSPWLHFTNLAFSTNPSIAAPNQGLKERARLSKRGRPPSAADGQIAAIASVNELVVVTANVKDFRRFKDVVVKDWSS